MKTYIGTKKVQAEPMNEFDAVQKGYARPNIDNHEWREGYYILYPDGYESWSPKNVFEQAYKCAQTHIDRMRIEYKELWDKTERLEKFIKSSAYSELANEDKALMRVQYAIMVSYTTVLIERLEKALL